MNFQTMPEDLQKIKPPSLKFEKQLRKSFSDPSIDLEIINPKLINALSVQESSTALKIKHIIFEKIIAIKDFGWKHFFNEVFLKNIYAFSCLIFIIHLQIYVSQYLNCNLDNTNVLVVLYVLARALLFELFYYYRMAIFSMKICWPNVPKHLIFFFLVALLFLLLKIYKIDPITSYVDIYISSIVIVVIKILLSYKTQAFCLQNLKYRALPLMSLYFYCCIFNYYAMKNIIIPDFKQTTLEIKNRTLGAAIFQISLFIYYRIYYKIFFIILMMLAKISNNSE